MGEAQPEGFGLLQLHCPDDPAVGICFVHGLWGGRSSTWIANELCWPRDLLPNDIPDARILSFGYDAKFVQFWCKVSQNNLDQHAANLLAALVGDRNDSRAEQRPIIFVAHSLGGLVCVKALPKAPKCVGEPNKGIEESTKRVAFLGTPFEGSDKAAWATTGKRFLALFKEMNEQLLDDLRKNSSQLATLAEDLPEWLRLRGNDKATKVEVVCFTEELTTSTIGKIVSDDSAHIKGYQVLSLHANHQDMCKFSGKDDQKYRTVLEVLKRWVKELKETPEIKPQNTATNNIQTTFSGTNHHGLNAGQYNAGNGPMNFGNWARH